MTIDCVRLSATLPERAAEQLQSLFWLLSPNGIEMADALCLGGGDLSEGQVRVALYVGAAEAAQAARSLVQAAERLGVAAEFAAEEVAAQDWNRVWKQHYAPLMVAGRVRVEPAWLQEPEQPGHIRIVIDPGMAFGTGTHETTQLCMARLVQFADAAGAAGVALDGLQLLDLGTGSGILAILACRLGFSGAIGTEIDAAAIDSARENLRLNGVSDRVALLHGGDPGQAGPARFPVVVANILASILVPLRDAILARVQPGGTLILSGILAREAQEVADHYAAAGLRIIGIDTAGAWACAVLQA